MTVQAGVGLYPWSIWLCRHAGSLSPVRRLRTSSRKLRQRSGLKRERHTEGSSRATLAGTSRSVTRSRNIRCLTSASPPVSASASAAQR
ncbi:MAG: hypothetical protein IPN17_00745 [Deltaproteobacteria bacterium]|nr:hypothetical protein [Deltaproteobacteria bacterium]